LIRIITSKERECKIPNPKLAILSASAFPNPDDAPYINVQKNKKEKNC